MTPDDRELQLPYLKGGIALLAFICLAILFYILELAGDLLIPFVVAVFIYVLLQPLIQLLTRWRLPRALITVIAMLVTIILLVGVSQVIYQSVAAFTSGLPRYEGRFTEIWHRIGALVGLTPDAVAGEWRLTDDPRVAEFLRGLSVPDLVRMLLASVNTLLSNLVLVFVYLLLLLLGRDMLSKKLERAFSPAMSGRLTTVTRGIRSNIQTYIIVKTLVGFLAAGAVMLITWIFGLDFVIIWGILTFVLSFIPSLGSIVAGVLPLLFALVQFESLAAAIWMGGLIFAVKFTIGNVVEPSMMGRSIDLSPLLIMFSLLFWGSVWGIVGMFLSVPLTAIVKIIFDNIAPLRPFGILMGSAPPPEPDAPR